MGSVYKFPIVLAALQRVDAGTLKLDQKITIEPKDFSPGWSPLRDEAKKQADHDHVRELLRYTVSISDNTACDNTAPPPRRAGRVSEADGGAGRRRHPHRSPGEDRSPRHLDEPGGRDAAT